MGSLYVCFHTQPLRTNCDTGEVTRSDHFGWFFNCFASLSSYLLETFGVLNVMKQIIWTHGHADAKSEIMI